MHDDFGIGLTLEDMPFGEEEFAQLLVVINLAVENDPDIVVFVGQRLMAALDVNNAQTPHGQADILFDEEAFVVGPSMRDSSIHAGQHVTLDVPVAIGKEDAADSTHIRVVSLRALRSRVRWLQEGRGCFDRSHVG